MVASGLVGRVDVAHERLAVHLVMASLIVVALVWTAAAIAPPQPADRPSRRIARGAVALLVLLVVQIALGGLVAGLKAGLVYDTWPLIEGRLIPPADGLFHLQPLWTNFTDNHLTVQFLHRMVAYALLALALFHAVDCMRERSGQRGGAVTLGLVLLTQAALGVITLLWHVPVLLALAHQLVAIVALVLATLHARAVLAARRAVAADARGEQGFAARPLGVAAGE
jgi:cytochrome c oxidase assembly protein subunit 15